MPRARSFWFVLVALLALTACSGGGDPAQPQTTTLTLPDYMQEGNETYQETGGVARPANAIDVFIVYSPESQQYMPRIIEAFNRASAEGRNPVTGAAWASGERPIYVAGQQPTSGSSGTVAQGIINAIIAPNNSNTYHPTLFQPSVSHWLALVNFQTGQQVFNLGESQPTALTPVVIAIWESRLRAIQQTIGKETISWNDLLGVLNSPNGWQDYGIQTERRAVYYGHTDPTISSTGLSTTIAEFYACARQNGFSERRLTRAAVESGDVQNCVRDIETLVRHYSSRTEDFLQYLSRGPEYLDMLAVEETDLICLNRGGRQGDEVCSQPPERLVAIYPEEGTFWHEHPFGIVNASWVTPEQQQAARVFTEFVLTPDMQRIIMGEGFRPANPDVPLEFPLVPENGVDPAQPATVLDVPDPEVIVAIQQSWRVVKKQADVVMLVDVSGSMVDENKIDQARVAMDAFLDTLGPTSRVALLTFSDRVTVWQPMTTLEEGRIALDQFITCEFNDAVARQRTSVSERCLVAEGSTSLYTGLRTAIDTIEVTGEEERIRAVLLLSDGQDTCDSEGCSTLQDVLSKIETSRETLSPVIVIPIAYGTDADVQVLNDIARSSRTTVVPGDPENITQILQVLGSFF